MMLFTYSRTNCITENIFLFRLLIPFLNKISKSFNYCYHSAPYSIAYYCRRKQIASFVHVNKLIPTSVEQARSSISLLQVIIGISVYNKSERLYIIFKIIQPPLSESIKLNIQWQLIMNGSLYYNCLKMSHKQNLLPILAELRLPRINNNQPCEILYKSFYSGQVKELITNSNLLLVHFLYFTSENPRLNNNYLKCQNKSKVRKNVHHYPLKVFIDLTHKPYRLFIFFVFKENIPLLKYIYRQH